MNPSEKRELNKKKREENLKVKELIDPMNILRIPYLFDCIYLELVTHKINRM